MFVIKRATETALYCTNNVISFLCGSVMFYTKVATYYIWLISSNQLTKLYKIYFCVFGTPVQDHPLSADKSIQNK